MGAEYPDKAEMKRRAEAEGRKLKVENDQRKRLSSPALVRLADRLGKPVEELLKRIPKDTLNRLKYPMRETVEDDGTYSFKDPIMVIDGPRSQLAGDQGKTHAVEPDTE